MMRLAIAASLLRGSAALVSGNITASEYHILLLGDWGGDDDSHPITSTETAVIKGMKTTCTAKSSQFVVLLGDNFYQDGVSSSTRDARFDAGFEKAFADPVWNNMPFYAIAGNHDHHKDANEQVKYHQKGSGRWNMPALNYNIDKTLPDGRTLRIVMFDSVVSYGQNYLDADGNQVQEPPADQFAADATASWLETQLSSFDGDFLFTAAHYPVHSGCKHGSVMRGKEVDGLLTKYNVNGHFAGHDHCLVHSIEGKQHHVLSGAGADNWYSWDGGRVGNEASVKWYMASNNYNSHKGGYTGLTFTETGGYFTYYGENGDVLYTSESFASRKPAPTPPVPVPAPTPPVPVPAPTPPEPTPVPAPTPASTCVDQCNAKTGWISNRYHNDDTLEKLPGVSATDCCVRCASNPACLTWNHAADTCRIKGGNALVESTANGHYSGLRCVTEAQVV